jgi:hypothetical protein
MPTTGEPCTKAGIYPTNCRCGSLTMQVGKYKPNENVLCAASVSTGCASERMESSKWTRPKPAVSRGIFL